MVDIVFPTLSTPGAVSQESGGALVNALPEVLGDGDNSYVVRKRAPGLRKLADGGTRVACRGLKAVGANLFVVYQDRAQLLTGSGGIYTITDLGTLAGSNPVTIAQNNKQPTPDVVCVADSTAYTLATSGAPNSYPDADVGSPNSVCFGDGYFFFTYGSGAVIASGLNSTSINPLDTANAESRPDGLLRGVFFRQELFLMGPSSIEVWQDTAQPTGFPFTRSTTIPRGLIGQWAVAGFEEGWANRLTWVADDKTVYTLDGYTPVRISTHDVERSIQGVSDVTTLRAKVYMSEGHALWELKGPTFGWVYDFTTQRWHERESYGLAAPRAEQSAFFDNRWLVGDAANGYIYQVDSSYFKEGDNPLEFRVDSLPMKGFPFRAMYARADFNFDQGLGSDGGAYPIETDPQVRISWSDDSGVTWSMPVSRALGAEGKYQTRVTVLRTGLANVQGRVWRISITDPVYAALLDGAAAVEQRAE